MLLVDSDETYCRIESVLKQLTNFKLFPLTIYFGGFGVAFEECGNFGNIVTQQSL